MGVAAPAPALNSVALFAETDAGAGMREYLSALETRGVEARGRLGVGDPYEQILTSADDYDLIVMAAHIHKGLSRYFAAHKVEKLVRRAPCPVLVLPSHEEDAAEAREPARPPARKAERQGKLFS
jgi:nucleotide-binding universal stress UspA family protein